MARIEEVIIRFVPHNTHRYPTLGDWELSESGRHLIITVSRMNVHASEIAVAVHEWVEAWQCKNKGIKGEDITKFDIAFEKQHFNDDLEPGNDPTAPYHAEHLVAEGSERAVCRSLGVTWKQHTKTCDEPL
jgi:hypothetical protein